jgi:tetratricopeptide (TPR) repeat protein
MSANLRSIRRTVTALFLTATLALAPAAPADDTPTPAQAIESARVLERSGLPGEAAIYLGELVNGEGAPLSESAEVLMEAARLTPSVEEARDYARRAIEHTRDSRLVTAAHMLIGDSLFAEKLYLAAAREYEEAARHSPGRGPSEADLRRAQCLLASGDALAAEEAFRDIAGWGSVPVDVAPNAELGQARSALVAGRSEEAAALFERAARASEDPKLTARALLGAAEAHRATGNREGALSALRSLVEEFAGSYEAALAREWLRTYPEPDTTAVVPDTAAPEVER